MANKIALICMLSLLLFLIFNGANYPMATFMIDDCDF